LIFAGPEKESSPQAADVLWDDCLTSSRHDFLIRRSAIFDLLWGGRRATFVLLISRLTDNFSGAELRRLLEIRSPFLGAAAKASARRSAAGFFGAAFEVLFGASAAAAGCLEWIMSGATSTTVVGHWE
jgi:hypothetical protein